MFLIQTKKELQNKSYAKLLIYSSFNRKNVKIQERASQHELQSYCVSEMNRYFDCQAILRQKTIDNFAIFDIYPYQLLHIINLNVYLFYFLTILIKLIILFKHNYQIQELKMQSSEGIIFILSHFKQASESSKRYLSHLIQESFEELGEEVSISLLSQWKTLSKLLNTPNKLNCLQDKYCRQLIIEFINQEAVEKYRTSYFNHAKISPEYLLELKRIGAYEFIQAIKIVNKLKLIEKHHREKMEQNTFSESHIDEKIRVLMASCLSRNRSENNNFAKFKAIVSFEDRTQLIKELGKLLRQSWANEKKNIKNALKNPQVATRATLDEEEHQTQILQMQMTPQIDDFLTLF